MHIAEGSYKQIGGDHDRVHATLTLARPLPILQSMTRPRAVCGEIPAQVCLNQTKVQELADKFTQPRKGVRYRDPSHVKAAFRRARREGSEACWKEAQQARRAARDQWLEAKVQRASQGSWKDMKDLKESTGTEWAVHLTEEAYAQKKDPLRWTASHFAQLFKAAADDLAAVQWGP